MENEIDKEINEIRYRLEKEMEERRRSLPLSIEEMLDLTEQVKEWKATGVLRHTEKEYSDLNPQVVKFQGRIGNITLDLESSSENSFSRWYRITASTPSNILGKYKKKESKCVSRLVDLYSGLESRYVQNYLEKVKSDMGSGLEEARRLIKKG